ncbi:hypothetical protein [Acetobacter persici]|nr:hypothetical protein [Acetobacter persici]
MQANLDTGWGAIIPNLTAQMQQNFEQDALTQAALEEIGLKGNTSLTPSDNAIAVVVEKFGLGAELKSIVEKSGAVYLTPDQVASTASTGSAVDTGIAGVSGSVSTAAATSGQIILDNSAVTPSNIPEEYQSLGYIPTAVNNSLGTPIYTAPTSAGTQDVAIQAGNTLSLTLDKATSTVTSYGGSLAAQGYSDAKIVGTYQNLNLSQLGLKTDVSAEVTGSATLDSVYGTVGLTLSGSGAQVISEDTNLTVTGNGGVLDADKNTLTASGTFDSIRINGVSGANINLGLTGSGMITDSTGTIGATLEGDHANFTIDGAGYDYLTAGQGSITLNNQASANITGVNSNGGNLFVNANGGQVNYQAETDVNATVNLGHGNAYMTYGQGYTATEVNMAGDTNADISGFTPSNGMLLATNLKALDDVSVTYASDNSTAYISEDGNPGKIVLHGVHDGGVDLLTSLNGANFTQEYGSNTLMIALNSHA